MPRILLPAALLCALIACLLPTGRYLPARAGSGCQFISSPGATAAFCDDFSEGPAGTGNRSGDLNGTIWGVSRINQLNNTGGWNDAWFDTTLDLCGTPTAVRPERDIQICNGHLAESVNDGENAAILAMYPTQPFDIAGRTGTVAFDVNADSEGGHAAWPTFFYTDKPFPAPYGATGIPDIDTRAANSFGFSLALTTPGCNGSGVDLVFGTSNYQPLPLTFTRTNDCVSFAPGQLNHFEVGISQNRIDIYGSDAGGANFHQLGFIANAGLTLTRGLIWIEDAHYAGCKFNDQCVHTFDWDNVAFDGPVLPGDLHLDAPDSLTPNSIAGVNLGYPFDPNTPVSFAIPGATEASVALAQQSGHGALLTFTAQVNGTPPITYTLNGNAPHTIPWPLAPDQGNEWNTFALPVPASELVAGTNSVGVAFGVSGVIANVDLILVGVRDTSGGPTATPAPPTSTGTATNTPPPPTATSTATLVPPTSTPVPPTATTTPVPPTVTKTPTGTSTPILPTSTKTATPTATSAPGQCSLESIVRNKAGVIVLHTTTPYAC